MKHIIFLLSVPIIIAGVFTSCKDKNKTIPKTYCEENPGSCKSVLEAKDFFVFKIGSWWVYQEESSGKRDSIYVTDYYNAENYDFDLRTHSTLKDYNYHYWVTYAYGAPTCNTLSPVGGKCLYVNRNKAKPGDYIGEGKCFFVNYTKNDFIYSVNTYFENNRVSVDDISEAYTLGNLEFQKTVKIHEQSSIIEGYQPTNHYYSKGVGLIRKELLDSNQVWNLVDYHIAY